MPKTKSRGAISKRIKVTKGGDTKKGKLKIGVIGRCHRMIKKQRERVLSGKKKTVLSDAHKRYRTML